VQFHAVENYLKNAWKKGANEGARLVNLSSIQKAVRGYQNMKKLATGRGFLVEGANVSSRRFLSFFNASKLPSTDTGRVFIFTPCLWAHFHVNPKYFALNSPSLDAFSSAGFPISRFPLLPELNR